MANQATIQGQIRNLVQTTTSSGGSLDQQKILSELNQVYILSFIAIIYSLLFLCLLTSFLHFIDNIYRNMAMRPEYGHFLVFSMK